MPTYTNAVQKMQQYNLNFYSNLIDDEQQELLLRNVTHYRFLKMGVFYLSTKTYISSFSELARFTTLKHFFATLHSAAKIGVLSYKY